MSNNQTTNTQQPTQRPPKMPNPKPFSDTHVSKAHKQTNGLMFAYKPGHKKKKR